MTRIIIAFVELALFFVILNAIFWAIVLSGYYLIYGLVKLFKLIKRKFYAHRKRHHKKV